jgi:hypothetical protein
MNSEVVIAELAWPEVPVLLRVRCHDRPTCTAITDVVCRAVTFLSPDETLVADLETTTVHPGADVRILSLSPRRIPRATKLRIVLRNAPALAVEGDMRVSVSLEPSARASS